MVLKFQPVKSYCRELISLKHIKMSKFSNIIELLYLIDYD